MRIAPLVLVMMTAELIACGPVPDGGVASPESSRRTADSATRVHQDSVNRTLPGYVVDSIRPISEELKHFRLAIGGRPSAQLHNGSVTRGELIRRFVTDLSANDTSDLRTILIDAREFADLIYPESPYTRAPYSQPPGLVWNQIQNPSRSGYTRLVRRLAGQRLVYRGHNCPAKPERQGQNRIWIRCLVQLSDATGTVTTHRLFGSIVERHGKFKFVSYANEF